MKQTTKSSKLEEQGLMFNELGKDNQEWGDKFKINVIINIAMVGGLNKSCRNNSLVVATLALGSRPGQRGCKVAGQEEARELKQKGCKGADQEEAHESHHIFPGM
jgi:hypothetical protein